MNIDPPDGARATSTVPPSASAIRRTSARPSPVPVALVVKKGWKMTAAVRGVDAGPLVDDVAASSVVSSRTVWALARTVTLFRLGRRLDGVHDQVDEGLLEHRSVDEEVVARADCTSVRISTSSCSSQSGALPSTAPFTTSVDLDVARMRSVRPHEVEELSDDAIESPRLLLRRCRAAGSRPRSAARVGGARRAS